MKLPLDRFSLIHNKKIIKNLTSVKDLNEITIKENEGEVYNRLKELKDNIDFQKIFEDFKDYNGRFLKIVLTIYSEDGREINDDFIRCASYTLTTLKDPFLVKLYIKKWKIMENLNANNINNFLIALKYVKRDFPRKFPEELRFLTSESHPTYLMATDSSLENYSNIVHVYYRFEHTFAESLYLLGFTNKELQKEILIKALKSKKIPFSAKKDIVMHEKLQEEYGHLSIFNKVLAEVV